MDGYDNGYGTQQSYGPTQWRRVVVDASGRVIGSSSSCTPTGADPQQIIFTSRSQRHADRPRTQVYRIGPRFNASVTRLDPRVDPRAERRYSVDSGLAQVIRVGGASAAAAGPRTVRLAPVRYADDDDQLQASQTAAVPQVIRLGSGRLRMVGRGETTATTPRQQPYRVIAANSDNTSPQRSFPPTAFYPRPTPVYLHQYQTSDSSADSIPVSAESARARVVGYQIPQLQISESPVEGGAPLSPESGARVVSYRIHPVSSDTDVDTRSRVVYSSECRAPVGQYQLGSAGSSLQAQGTGGWTVGSNDDQYNASKSSGGLSRGVPASDVDTNAVLPGTDGRRTVRIQIGESSDSPGHRGPSNEGITDSHKQQHCAQTQLAHRDRTFCRSDQPPTQPGVKYSDGAGGMPPSFTVQAVGPVTDFGQLVCESIRQFLIHKQRQQQQQQQQTSAVPWRRPRDFVAQSPVVVSAVGLPQSGVSPGASPNSVFHERTPTPSSFDPMQSGEVASPSLDDRNMFQRYGFQFGSIGNFGRDVSSVQATPTGSEGGSWGRPVVRYNGGGSTAGLPVAVFRFQDFDDMVARMRDETASQANTDRQRDVSHHHHHQQQQQQQQQQLQKDWRGTPLHTSVDYETDEDSGYSTSRSGVEYQPRNVMIPVDQTQTSDAWVPPNVIVDSREELRRKIASFNNNSQGFFMSLEQNSDIFHGFIRVVMNLIRPVQMSLTSQRPTSDCDVTQNEVTTFHLPKDTTKVIHITSETTTREVIGMLLSKFHIKDNPRKFALYEQMTDKNNDQGQGGNGRYMRRLGDTEMPLPLCLRWVDRGSDALDKTRFVLQENDTGEIMWEAFSLPELESFLLILHKEEDAYVQEIRETYHVLRLQMQARLSQLRQDRIGPGAKLQGNHALAAT